MKTTKVETSADVLIRAFEMADEIESVIIIYQRKSGSPGKSCIGCIDSDDMTIESANFLVDSYKAWLWSALREKDE